MVAHTENLAELLGAALNRMEEAIAVLDAESRVVFWNPAAAEITGYRSADLLSRRFPPDLYQVDAGRRALAEARLALMPPRLVERRELPRTDSLPGQPLLVTLRHSQGHSLPGMLRTSPLRDELGKRCGTLLRFHPVEDIDTLPHGAVPEDNGNERRVEQSQAEMEDRLDEAWREWKSEAIPFGLLWVAVDQAAALRRTHGHDASEAMMSIVERTLMRGLRPAEVLGRWGANEFLVISHERSVEMLRLHAEHVRELASSAEFRWWGDRVDLTFSIGVVQASGGGAPGSPRSSESLSALMTQAQLAMQSGQKSGGNTVVIRGVEVSISGGGERKCSQS